MVWRGADSTTLTTLREFLKVKVRLSTIALSASESPLHKPPFYM